MLVGEKFPVEQSKRNTLKKKKKRVESSEYQVSFPQSQRLQRARSKVVADLGSNKASLFLFLFFLFLFLFLSPKDGGFWVELGSRVSTERVGRKGRERKKGQKERGRETGARQMCCHLLGRQEDSEFNVNLRGAVKVSLSLTHSRSFSLTHTHSISYSLTRYMYLGNYIVH